MTEQQRQEFTTKAHELMKWLCENGHPHMTIAITQTSAELLESVVSSPTQQFLVD